MTTTATAQSFSDYRWKNRLLILVSNQNETQLVEQKRLFENVANEMNDRDLLLFNLEPNNKELKKHYNIEANFTGVILIGKDGGVKLKKPFLIKVSEVFELIDGMPMRRAEMRKY